MIMRVYSGENFTDIFAASFEAASHAGKPTSVMSAWKKLRRPTSF